MLGALIMYGLSPGREMMTTRLDLVYLLIAVGVISNVIALFILLGITKFISTLANVRMSLLFPPLLVLLCFATYVMRNNIIDTFAMLIFAIIGVFMSAYKYPRSVFLIAFVLAPIMEKNMFLAIQTRGPFFFLQRWPTMLILGIVAVFYIWPVIKKRLNKREA